jgi:hypothetical protein
VSTAHRDIAVHRRLMRFGEAESIVAPVWDATDTTVRSVAAHLSRLWSMTQLEDGAVVV